MKLAEYVEKAKALLNNLQELNVDISYLRTFKALLDDKYKKLEDKNEDDFTQQQYEDLYATYRWMIASEGIKGGFIDEDFSK